VPPSQQVCVVVQPVRGLLHVVKVLAVVAGGCLLFRSLAGASGTIGIPLAAKDSERVIGLIWRTRPTAHPRGGEVPSLSPTNRNHPVRMMRLARS
jgi:hypothetical protein